MICFIFCICLTQESLWLGLFDHQKKTEIQNSNWKAGGNGPQYVARPFISQNSSCPKSRLLCTQKKRIRTTVSTQQSKKDPMSPDREIVRNLPKYEQLSYIFHFRHFLEDFSVRWTRIFLWIGLDWHLKVCNAFMGRPIFVKHSQKERSTL